MSQTQTLVVTGCNCGLGLECVKQILFDQWTQIYLTETLPSLLPSYHIVMACRSAIKAQEALSSISNVLSKHEKQLKKHSQSRASSMVDVDSLHRHVSIIVLDLASITSIQQFVHELSQKVKAHEIPPLYSLVCNAGLQLQNDVKTVDGFEATFGVNHLGHFLLINLMIPLFESNDNSVKRRIIIVSSDVHDPQAKTGMPTPHYQHPRKMAYPFDDYQDDKNASLELLKNPGHTGRVRYSTSKLCNLLCGYELERRLQNSMSTSSSTQSKPAFTVNMFNPGFVPTTSLARDYHPALVFIAHHVLPLLSYVTSKIRTLHDSGSHLKRLVVDPSLEHVSGKYFDGDTLKESTMESHDREKQRELWEESIKLILEKAKGTLDVSAFL
ncbi:hypothetical protein C9374_003611 [Naegleria lovaniensis]|uniref:Short-chain dehydrogenase n=1 Tax=Naegleria lovaniensis TaxID=51637 RepID=A0AA88KS64_NAELO|nr:uncharacterized protein C9374_003611 [Naegleria lovaniensis]KAG2393847.1 hypothetical protein C9374_003611 [Naegleria lovaniensis]